MYMCIYITGVYRGGDVAMHFLSILHPHGDLPHAQRIAPGVYWQCDLQVCVCERERASERESARARERERVVVCCG